MKVEKIKPINTSNYLSLLYEKSKQKKKQPKTSQNETKNSFENIFKECMKTYE